MSNPINKTPTHIQPHAGKLAIMTSVRVLFSLTIYADVVTLREGKREGYKEKERCKGKRGGRGDRDMTRDQQINTDTHILVQEY